MDEIDLVGLDSLDTLEEIDNLDNEYKSENTNSLQQTNPDLTNIVERMLINI